MLSFRVHFANDASYANDRVKHTIITSVMMPWSRVQFYVYMCFRQPHWT